MFGPLKQLLGVRPSPMIHTYRGFGSESEAVVLGRITEYQKRNKATSKNSFRHALRFTRSYVASPLADISVRVDFASGHTTVITDETGIFEAHVTPKDISEQSATEWFTAIVSLPDFPEIKTKKAPVLIEGRNNTFGIISDIDDTVLVSNATQKLKLLYATIFKSAERRLPFAGVSQLYNALVRGADGRSSNPIFYVSSSHWNLYDFLKRFFELNTLPQGPLMLKRTTGLKSIIATTGKHHQKHEAITTIMNAYPELPFVLLGDSGQQDAEIYSTIAKEHPGRILTIYIRDVTVSEDNLVKEATKTLGDTVPIISAKTSLEIARHARSLSLISEDGYELVADEFTEA